MLFSERVTPQHIVKWSMRVLCVSAPLAVGLLVAWMLQPWERMNSRPHVVMMVYLLLLGISTGAGITAALSACHLAISKAFVVGVHVGQQNSPQQPQQPPQASLRAVE